MPNTISAAGEAMLAGGYQRANKDPPVFDPIFAAIIKYASAAPGVEMIARYADPVLAKQQGDFTSPATEQAAFVFIRLDGWARRTAFSDADHVGWRLYSASAPREFSRLFRSA